MKNTNYFISVKLQINKVTLPKSWPVKIKYYNHVFQLSQVCNLKFTRFRKQMCQKDTV